MWKVVILCVVITAGCFITYSQAQFPWDTCPDNSDVITTCQITSDSCLNDYHCPWGLRCCPGGCGRTCQRPTRCQVSPFPRFKRFCVYDGMCDRARDQYCCNFRCQEPFATIG